MIEPRRSGPGLLEEIAGTRPGPGAVAVWWLGQSGYLLKSVETLVAIDPYLSEHLTLKYANTERPHVRMTRAPFRGGDLAGVDLVLCSHRHSDHLDPGTAPDLMQRSEGASLVVPAALVEQAVGLGIERERVIGIDAGESLRRPGVSVRAVPSAHEGLDTDERGRHLYLGFVVEIGGVRLYHSGDSLAYDGLAEAIGPEPLDLMFLPINGRDPSRGVPGNMSAAEAVDLANVLKPRFVVPHHYDMFTFNTVPVAGFEAEARRLGSGISANVLACGERWGVSRWV